MRGKILVVDDAHHIRELFQEILTDEGYEVETLAAPFTDLADVIYRAPDLIVLDYLFGAEPAGGRMIQQLAASAATRHIPVILCTASAKAIAVQEQALASLGGTVLQKPFALDDLLQIVQQALASREGHACPLPEPALRPDPDRTALQHPFNWAELRPVFAL